MLQRAIVLACLLPILALAQEPPPMLPRVVGAAGQVWICWRVVAPDLAQGWIAHCTPVEAVRPCHETDATLSCPGMEKPPKTPQGGPERPA